MSYLTQHWSFDPFLIIAVIAVMWHEIGLARLARRSPPDPTRQRRRRSLLFYSGLAVLLIAVQSPIEYWSYDYFFVHMIQHLLLMFAAPTLVVAGAPWQPLLDALPVRYAKNASEVTSGGGFRHVRAAGGFLLRPWVSVAIFSIVMIFWHLPGPFDLAERNDTVQVWLMHSSFFIAGVLFWLQFIGSPPFRIKMSAVGQATALLATNIVMWVLAMAMGFLSSSSWYSVYNHVPGVTLPAFADQQIGAGILWICGDFWAIPTMIFVIRKLMAEDGSISAAVDRILGRGSARYNWANRGRVLPLAGNPDEHESLTE
ncbi:MAG TPA: cytochrome c oxidase assembly protein [Streptosporangiaceae bacterium]|nr:cytochrome c oxidase assembly protein [Streptosporangiaceae bacterium]